MIRHKSVIMCHILSSQKMINLYIFPFAVLFHEPGELPKPRKCGPNEIWKECVSPECAEQTCPPKNVDACTSLCTFDCYCADGFARDRRGICISVRDCLTGGPRSPQHRPFGHDVRGQSSWPLNLGSRFRHFPRPPSYPGPHIVY